MYSVNNISVHFSGNYLFEDVSFLVNPRDRIGLVGRNGTGKTTLLRIINREFEPESGEVVIPAGKKVGYLPQEIDTFSHLTVLNEAMSAFDETLKLKGIIDGTIDAIGLMQEFHSDKYMHLVDQLNRAKERFEVIGGYTVEARTEKVLLGLGFKPADFNRPMSEMSGGWQMRVKLARILLAQPDLLLLDEPTNHLDIESIQWLEDFLASYPGAVILVSHDRALLDNVTSRTIEISLGRIIDFKANYSEFVVMREQLRERQMETWSNQQRQIAQIERFIERFRYKNTKSRQVQSRIRMIEKMDRVEVDETDQSAIHFSFPPAPRSGKLVFEAKDLSKHFGDLEVLRNLNFAVTRNDAIAFVGRNGEGKTTLSRIIVGELDHEGSATLGHQVSIGYYAQNQSDLLDPEKTVFQTIDDIAVGETRPKIRGILGSFLFSGDTIYKKVKVLSGGEKSRLAIATLLLRPVNLLVLDEPSNHLDMYSKDILKNALIHYDGTLIIVSHDRDFLQGLTNKVFEFSNKGIRQYIGDIYDYLENRKLSSLKELEMEPKRPPQNEARPVSDQKLKYEEKKKLEKEQRKITSQIHQTEERIHHLEQEISKADRYLSDPVMYSSELAAPDFYDRYASLKAKLDEEVSLWDELHRELDKWKEEHR
ncbi:MAG TPA: ABC-F family ATP-binding cassette domain-containing protein [Bacteroidales bacterium]|nr:ABC-F family ATP-binding cassette domain-containing protein [Bacteroidales bacterium]HRZ21699.1 ABC-F family ATP-binding cassette domain-containing protein [Bacteroidales bacterium]